MWFSLQLARCTKLPPRFPPKAALKFMEICRVFWAQILFCISYEYQIWSLFEKLLASMLVCICSVILLLFEELVINERLISVTNVE